MASDFTVSLSASVMSFWSSRAIRTNSSRPPVKYDAPSIPARTSRRTAFSARRWYVPRKYRRSSLASDSVRSRRHVRYWYRRDTRAKAASGTAITSRIAAGMGAPKRTGTVTGLLYSLHPGHEHLGHGGHALGRALVRRVAQPVPVRVTEVDDVDGRDPGPVQGDVV